MTKADPNDARHVIWALGKCFFFTNLCLIVYLGSYIKNTGLEGKGELVMVKTGLNDTRCVVWALGKPFYIYY